MIFLCDFTAVCRPWRSQGGYYVYVHVSMYVYCQTICVEIILCASDLNKIFYISFYKILHFTHWFPIS